MTNEEVNKLVAEKVMKWDVNFMSARDPGGAKRLHWRDDENSTMYLPSQWCPSENMEQAWEVVEKMREEGIVFDYNNRSTPGVATFGYGQEGECFVGAEEAPRAISLAALKFIGIKV